MTDRLRDTLGDLWSLAIVGLTIAIVAPPTTAWLHLGGLGWVKALLVESAEPAGVPIRVVALHPLEHGLTEIGIGVGLAVFVGVEVALARQWLRRRGHVPTRSLRSIAAIGGSIAVWLGLAVTGGAVAVQGLGLPAVRLVATPGETGPAVVRLGTLFGIVATLAVVGAVVPHALTAAALWTWRRRSNATDTAL